MPKASQRPPSRGRPNAEQLRYAIDSGSTRDKVPMCDPAAASLGTDDEAGGVRPSPEQVAAAAQYEMAHRAVQHTGRKSNAVIVVAVLLAVLATVAAILLTRV